MATYYIKALGGGEGGGFFVLDIYCIFFFNRGV